ncbi:MAG: CusA/CzcA family heavy metal efflux RND transporter [Alphaproteobacteria bacterium]|nr:MAG: CusA/CzcA family heavy metal efflux RND transporter [Alphaproteobacteria bacterium]
MIESILGFSIARRQLVLTLVLAFGLYGAWNFQVLPIDAVPDITNIQVQVNTEAPGYSPLEVEQRITFPVETGLAGMPNLESTRSLSRYGLSQVTVVFDEGTDIYFARNLIDQRIAGLKGQLPPGFEPTMGPISTGLGEIFMYNVYAMNGATQDDGSPYDITALREIQDWIIRPQLILVDGVTEVNSSGGYKKQYHVTPDPTELMRYGLTFEKVVTALRNNNENRGAGYIESNGQQLLVRSPGQLQNITDIENVVIAKVENTPIRVRDVAEVAIGKELRTGAATRYGKEAVIGSAFMLMGENSRTVARDVATKLEEINTSLPPGIIAEAVYDRSDLVDKTITTVSTNLLEGALLVILILFLLLGNVRAAILTALVIPFSMLGTITGMVTTGVSANLMSLGALDFGLIVDGAVIIVENCVRRLSEAQRQTGTIPTRNERLTIVFDATNEVIRPSLFGISIITFVYLPIFALTGIEGKMFHPMAISVILALSTAMILSITLVPASLAVVMTGKISETENFLMRVIKRVYRPVLLLALKLRWLVSASVLGFVFFCIWLVTTLGSEFIPQLDEGDITLQALRIPGTGIDQAVRMQGTLENVITPLPEVLNVFSRIGTAEVATDPMPPAIADTFIQLKPRNQWPDPDKTKAEFIEELEELVSGVPGNNYEFTQPIQMRFNEMISGVRADLGVKVFGDDLNLLLIAATSIREVIENIDGASDVNMEQVGGLPVLTVTPNRDALARYGMNTSELQELVATAMGGEDAGIIYEGDRRFDLVVRLPESFRTDISRLERLPVWIGAQDEGAEFVPLLELADISTDVTPNQINRENGKRRVVVTSNIRGRDLTSFVEEAAQRIQAQVNLPPGYYIEFGGTFENLVSATQRLSIVVPVTLVIIFGILLMAFSNFRDALIIFTGVPLALTGGVLALWYRGMPLSISAGVGFIALSGVAVLNGLVMLSFIKSLFEKDGDLQRAIVEGAMTRLRPVLMTALVASLGFIPMALNIGTGAEVQRPIATVVIGGIISSTILTLIVLPALYHIAHFRKT